MNPPKKSTSVNKKAVAKKTAPPPKPATKAAAIRAAKPVSKLLADSREATFPVVGIGTSAGGLEAFEALFKEMPSGSGIAFVLVAHLDPSHISLLPELIQKSTKMKVQQVKDNMKVKPDQLYIIPPNREMAILNGHLHLLELSLTRRHLSKP